MAGRCAAVGKVGHLVTLALEQEAQDLGNVLVVFDHDDGSKMLFASHMEWKKEAMAV
jgi:hypothetical protein